MTAFRQAPYPPTETAGQTSHAHGDVRARGAIIRSTDGGQTWPLDTVRVLAEQEQGVEQMSVSVVSGDLLLAPADSKASGETCSTQLPDGRVITVYYWTNGDSDPMRYIKSAIYTI